MEVRKAINFKDALFIFLICLRILVDDPETDALVSWNNSNNGFIVWDTLRFSSEVLPRYYNTRNLASFVRQLNKHGFKKNVGSPHWEYINKDFIRGVNHLEPETRREEIVQETFHGQKQAAGESTYKRRVLKTKGKRKIKDDDGQSINIQSTDLQWLAQQMIPYLVKAMQTPEFELLLARQMNDCSSQISGDIKRRRLPNSSYQPLMDEPRNVVSEQFMKTTASTTLGSTDFSAALRDSSSNGATHATSAPSSIHPSYNGAPDNSKMHDSWPFKGSRSAGCHDEIPVVFPHHPSKNYNVPAVSSFELQSLHNMVPLADILPSSNEMVPEASAGTDVQEENVNGEAENTYLASDVPDLSTSDYLREGSEFSVVKMTASTTMPGPTNLSNSQGNTYASTRVLYRGSSSGGAIHSELDVLQNTFAPLISVLLLIVERMLMLQQQPQVHMLMPP